MILQIILSFIATVSFAVLFHVPRQQYFFCGLTGACGWLCYLLVTENGGSVVLASFVAAIALTFISRILAVVRKMPITVFLICGIFPIVPGAGIYYTAYYIMMNENALASAKGMETLKIAVAISLGIALVISLPYRLFSKKQTSNRY